MGIGNYFMNTNVDLFHDSTNNSNGILTSESNEMDLNTGDYILFYTKIAK